MNRNAIILSSICVAGLLAGCGARQAVTVNSKKQYDHPVKAGVKSVMVLNDYRIDDHLFRPAPNEPTTVTIQTKGGGDIFYVATSTTMTRGEHSAKAIMTTIGIALADSYPLVFAENDATRARRLQDTTSQLVIAAEKASAAEANVMASEADSDLLKAMTDLTRSLSANPNAAPTKEQLDSLHAKVTAIEQKRKAENDARAQRLKSEIATLKKLIADIKEAEEKRLKDETAAAKTCLSQFLSSLGQLSSTPGADNTPSDQAAVLSFLFPLETYGDITAFKTAATAANSTVPMALLHTAKEYKRLAGTDDPKPGIYGDKIEKFQVREAYDVGTLQVSALWVPKSSVFSAAHITVRPFADISTYELVTNFVDRIGIDVGMAATGIGGSSTDKLEDTIGLMSGISFKLTNGFGIGCGNLMLIPKDSATGDTTNRFYASATIDVLKLIDMISKQSVTP